MSLAGHVACMGEKCEEDLGGKELKLFVKVAPYTFQCKELQLLRDN
jgi:hypothetical protein